VSSAASSLAHNLTAAQWGRQTKTRQGLLPAGRIVSAKSATSTSVAQQLCRNRHWEYALQLCRQHDALEKQLMCGLFPGAAQHEVVRC
jgi:hypothetical protein